MLANAIQKSWLEFMINDEIITEVREIREAHTAKFNTSSSRR